MSDSEAVRRFLTMFRPNSKFIKVSHSSEFLDPEANLGQGFYHASVYDEEVNANLNETKFGDVLIENSYIASFAYNIFLCWIFHSNGHIDTATLESLILYNLKKLCAEQLYRADNSVRARTLLLESILYEQTEMQAIFAAKTQHPDLFKLAVDASHLMLLILNQHEFAHYMMRTQPALVDAFLDTSPEIALEFLNTVPHLQDPNFRAEFRCDLFATLTSFRQYNEHHDAKFVIRCIAFAFAAFSSIYSIAATARETAAAWQREGLANVDFLDIESKVMPSFDLHVQWNIDFAERAILIHAACDAMARDNGFELFGTDGTLGLQSTILEDCVNPIQFITECRNRNARELSNLIAQAFTGHDEGFEFLYLRSKTFQTNRTDPLVV